MTAAIPRREPTSTHLVALSLQACGVLPSPTHGDQELPNSKASPILKCGSSDIRWGSWGESAGGEEHAEPVVVAVAEAAGEAAVQLDDPVHGLSAAVR